MKNDSFAVRLNLALDKEGFPPLNRGRIQLLAEMVGLTHRGASKWVNGETCPPAKKYMDLAHKLNVREEWLRIGQEPMLSVMSSAQPPPQLIDSTLVYVYMAEEFFSPIKNPQQTIHCDLPRVGNLFAIKLETEAMSPRFPKGSVIIFDDKKEALDGDFVLASYDSYPAPIFRQLLVIGSTRYLNAHNPKFDRLSTEISKIYGTMIQAIISFV